MFSRTLSGTIAKYLFYDRPLLWVEGPSDVPFYSAITSGLDCRIQAAGGKEECDKLASALLEDDLPYLVAIDGHYDILRTRRSQHRRIILLHRHSIENYFFEPSLLNSLACNYCSIEPPQDICLQQFSTLLNHLKTYLEDLIVLDIALITNDSDSSALPRTYLEIQESRDPIRFSEQRISSRVKEHRKNLDEDDITFARELLQDYLKEHRISDILRGHIIFGLIRDLFVNAVKRKAGRSPNIDNCGLSIMLSQQVWDIKPHRDHISLWRRLRRGVRECQQTLG